MEIAYYGGEFIDINEKVIPIQERGHQFGDGIYEVIRVYHGDLFLVEEHLDRLEKSASAIKIDMPLPRQKLHELMKEGLKRSGLQDAEVYIQITRGIAPRTHYFPDTPSQLSMTVKKARTIDPNKQKSGVPVILLEDERWSNCYIKSLNLLPNILAKQTAVTNGFDEAVLVRDGIVTEGSSSNIFVYKDNILYTPPATKKILHGITRAAVIRIAEEQGLIVREQEFGEDFLLKAEEAFITSTSVEVLPISSVNHHPLPNNRPVTTRIMAAYQNLYEQ